MRTIAIATIAIAAALSACGAEPVEVGQPIETGPAGDEPADTGPDDAAGAAPEMPTPQSSAMGLTPEAALVYQRSLRRDAGPSCADLTAGLDAPAAALLEVAERVQAPPSSPIRAATCLLREHVAEVEPHILAWVRDRQTMGLGLLALNHLDQLDPAVAERVAAAALQGSFAETARPRIARTAVGTRVLARKR